MTVDQRSSSVRPNLQNEKLLELELTSHVGAKCTNVESMPGRTLGGAVLASGGQHSH